MSFTVWVSLFVICLLGAMSPGPSLATVAKHSLAGGRLNGLVAAWSHALGIGFYALITIVGLAVVLQQSPLLFKVISLSGALYLAYLGWNAIQSKGGIAEKLKTGEPVPLLASAREGLLISLLSPKIALFFIALFSQFIAVSETTNAKAIIVATPFLVDGLWYTIITLMLSSPLLVDRLKRQAKLIDRLSGIVLILLAARVVWINLI
jgi:threonine/homoserine/homoserine lactone efflux protein